MVKLSYVSRKTEGIKIAQACHKDIMKKVAAEAKEVAKNGYSTKDSHLELHLTGRKIADEGLELVCSALLEALSGGTLKLDELHLSNNSITAKGLPTLGKVIRAASKQLRDLDLAGNLIKAETESEREAFTGFLRDLGEVECLLRLDFGGNPLGLGFGFEIMLRQYAREKPIRSEDLEARLFEIEEAEAMAKRSKRERGKGRDSGIGLEENTSYESFVCRGLRSIPYIIISEVQMDDASALQFSFILERHLSPRLLQGRFSNFKAGSHLTSVLANLQNTAPNGIGFFPNTHLSQTGMRLLQEADRLRRCGRDFSATSSEDEDDEPDLDDDVYRGRELDRLRSKIEGSIIEREGVRRIELWSVCMEMLQVSRALLCSRVDEEFPAVTNLPEIEKPIPTRAPRPIEKVLPIDPAYNEEFPTLASSPSNGSINTMSRPRKGSIHQRPALPSVSTNTTSKSLTLRITNKNPPKLANAVAEENKQKTIREGNHTRSKSGTPMTFPLATSIELALPTPPATPPPRPTPAEYLSKHNQAEPTRLAGGLPPRLWRQILVHAFDQNRILSIDQQIGVLNYGISRETLKAGHELRGKRVGTQIWEFLEGSGGRGYALV